jgi:glutaredoxin 3
MVATLASLTHLTGGGLMKPVTVYTTDYCPYCVRAKKLLKAEQVPFTEVDVTHDDAKRHWLTETTGQRTVPQIFFGDDPIGGCTDMEALMKAGTFRARLAA